MGGEEDRAVDSKFSDTLTDVGLCIPERGKTEKRSLKRPFAKLSVQCPSPCSSLPKKGSPRCLTTGIWGLFWENKTIKRGGWIFTFLSLSIAFVTFKSSTDLLVFPSTFGILSHVETKCLSCPSTRRFIYYSIQCILSYKRDCVWLLDCCSTSGTSKWMHLHFTLSTWLKRGVAGMSVVGCLCTVILTAHRRGTGLYFMNITSQRGQRQEGEKQVESGVWTRKWTHSLQTYTHIQKHTPLPAVAH